MTSFREFMVVDDGKSLMIPTMRFIFSIMFIFVVTSGICQFSQVRTTQDYSCVGEEVVFFLQGGSDCAAPYVSNQSSWNVSGGGTTPTITYIQTQTNPVGYNQIRVIFNSPGTYQVYTGYSCISGSNVTTPIYLDVYAVTVPTVSLISDSLFVCTDKDYVSFTASTTNGGATNYYTWYKNGLQVAQGTTPSYKGVGFKNGDKITVGFTSTKVCVSPVTVGSNPVVINLLGATAPRVTLSSLKQIVNSSSDVVQIKAYVSGSTPVSTVVWKVNGVPATSDQPGLLPYTFVKQNWNYASPSIVECDVIPQGQCASATSAFINIYDCTPVNGLTMSIDNPVQFLCAMKFNASIFPASGYSMPNNNQYKNCAKTYNWTFGDGTTSKDASPIHAYASSGTYNVSLTINYNCSFCSKVLTATKSVTYIAPTLWTESQLISYTTDQKPGILTTTASTYSDAWPLSHPNTLLDDKSSFITASQGVWRNNGAFVYKKDRQLSSTTDLANDGTFTLDRFNWQYADVLADVNWIEADNMTRYSPFGFELESKDVLDVYSGAIYEYGGQLPVANGVNMRNDEMAFTSFEVFAGNVTAGNWTLSSGSIPVYYYYRVNAGDRNMAIVEASQAQLSGIVNVDVSTEKPNITGNSRSTYTKGNQIVCTQTDPDNANWSMVVLRNAPVESYWTGMLRVKNQVSPNINAVFDSNFAHSGKTSLKVTNSSSFSGVKQEQLRLTPGQTYFVSGWVTVGTSPTTPSLGNNLGMTIVARANNGTAIQTFPVFTPTGPVIEGWQQFQGTFAFPTTASYIDVTLGSGVSGAWYDDLRLQPQGGNMKCYVYDVDNFRLKAILDEDNFASYFYYDLEGALHVTKKETIDGVKTLTENISYQKEQP